MPNVIAKQASDIRVWDTYSLDKLSKNKTLRKDVEKEINKKNALHHSRGYIYKSLCLLPQGDDKIIEHESYLENEYLYPLNPIILCFVTPENLRSRFEIKQAQNTYHVSKN